MSSLNHLESSPQIPTSHVNFFPYKPPSKGYLSQTWKEEYVKYALKGPSYLIRPLKKSPFSQDWLLTYSYLLYYMNLRYLIHRPLLASRLSPAQALLGTEVVPVTPCEEENLFSAHCFHEHSSTYGLRLYLYSLLSSPHRHHPLHLRPENHLTLLTQLGQAPLESRSCSNLD